MLKIWKSYPILPVFVKSSFDIFESLSYIRKIFTYTVPLNFYENMEADTPDFIELENKPLNVIKEGKAEITIPTGSKVFYNPVQEFNRDLSVLSLQVFSKQIMKEFRENSISNSSKSFKILEALSATGLRSIRYAKEVPNVTHVIANDLSNDAIDHIKKNILHNQVENLVETSHSNAIDYMFSNSHPSKRFQAVDLDPYGCPTQFLDSAIQCVSDGGILLVTCTDMAVLCGNFPETCFVKYGAVSLKAKSHHELAIRIVLQHIQAHASRYKRYIVPLLSVSVDFYIRVIVKVFTSAAACKSVTSNLAMVFHCIGCDTITLQPLGIKKKADESKKNVKYALPSAPAVGVKCTHCGAKHRMGGPIWIGPIHDQSFVDEMLKSKEINEFNTSKRLLGILSVIKEELHDVPLYYDMTHLCSVLKCSMSMMVIRSAILNGGYKVSYSHAHKTSVKTNAPASFIWDILRTWVKDKPINKHKIIPGSPADVILNTSIQHEIDFSLRPDANPLSRELKLTRYQVNPQRFWGPGTKSMANNLMENPKRLRNQDKKKRTAKSEINFSRGEKEPRLENN